MLAGTIGSRPDRHRSQRAGPRLPHRSTEALRLRRPRPGDWTRGAPSSGAPRASPTSSPCFPGARPEAIGLLSHYDSAPESPGAADDGLGVAVSLEAARVLAARSDRTWTHLRPRHRRRGIGAHGRGRVDDRPRGDVAASRRTSTSRRPDPAGPPILFEAGPGNAWLIGPWARRAPHPRGALVRHSKSTAGCRTTRTSPILARQGIPGLNFALVGDGYAYHTARDVPERLKPKTAARDRRERRGDRHGARPHRRHAGAPRGARRTSTSAAWRPSATRWSPGG